MCLTLKLIIYTLLFSPVSEVSWYRDTMLLESDNNIYFHKKGTLHTMTIRRLQMPNFGKFRFKLPKSTTEPEWKGLKTLNGRTD